MKIGINFEDTLTDSNYSIIDVINITRNKGDFIDYEDFDESGYHSIWDYPLVTSDEIKNKSIFIADSFKLLDLVVMAKSEIKSLMKNSVISEDVEFQVFTEYSETFKTHVENFLVEKGLGELTRDIIYGINEDNINEKLKNNNIDIYIEDNPYIIKECSGVKPLIIVRSHNYNETCYNLMRLECYSQVEALLKRAEKKIEKNNIKIKKEEAKEELRKLREAVRGN